MPLSSWLCTNSSKNMFVKIVHPGGHAELHDGPILAAQLMLRNPRCCVAHPQVFQQPWAIVSPDTMLELGHKYYVVPISTIRKLQRVSLKYSPKTTHDMQSNVTPNREDKKNDEENNGNSGFNFAGSTIGQDGEKEGCFSKDNCFASIFMVTKMKENGDDLKEEAKSSSSSSSISSSETETKALTRKTNKDSTRGSARGSPKRFATLDHWQPSLESIHEE